MPTRNEIVEIIHKIEKVDMAQVIFLPLDKIDTPESIRVIDQPMYQALKASILEVGLVNPILVENVKRKGLFWFLKEKRFKIRDGYLRYKVMQDLGSVGIASIIME